MPQQYLLDLSILPKNKKLNREGDITGLLEVTVQGSFLMKIGAPREAFGFTRDLIGSKKKVYYCRQVCRNCFETHHDSLICIPLHVLCLTFP